MKLDILVIVAHPDDAELGCGGTMAAHIAKGHKVGIIDLTKGEMGTRGTPEIRQQEADAAAEILKLSVRENIGFRDGFFKNDEEHQLKVIEKIRKYRPDIIITNATYDRHPDHGMGSELIVKSSFLSGLEKIETFDEGVGQEAWRPKSLYHIIQSVYIKPDIVVDVSSFWNTKIKSIQAFKSQFFNPESAESETYISSPEFMKLVEARGKEFGHSIGAEYGEGFNVSKMIGVGLLTDLR